jgi:hypothetical protein
MLPPLTDKFILFFGITTYPSFTETSGKEEKGGEV